MITFALGFACGGLVVFALWFFMALRGFVVPFKVETRAAFCAARVHILGKTGG